MSLSTSTTSSYRSPHFAYGAGVKGKINQSMGFGVPVVATPIAVEGMPVIDGEDVVIAEEPAVFAEKLTALSLGGTLAAGFTQQHRQDQKVFLNGSGR